HDVAADRGRAAGCSVQDEGDDRGDEPGRHVCYTRSLAGRKKEPQKADRIRMRAQHSFLVLALIALISAAFAQDASDPARDKAADLKKRASYAEAAKAFEQWASDHAQDPRASEAQYEAAQCHFSNARGMQKAQRNTPESLAEFKVALDQFGKLASMDPPAANS